jgi:UDP-N-acetylmuramoyl-tripeptide--D-alanyl-D-alanine ligase
MAQQRGFNTSAGNCTGYGLNYSGAEVLPSSAEHPFLRIRLTNGEILETQLVGSYNADNVMAAIAVGAEFEISSEEAAAAIAAYSPSNNRSQMTKTEANTLIVDAYNANPTSMEAALDNFINVHASKKIAMLGDMRELGEESEKEHIRIAEKALGLGLSKVIFVGEEFGKVLSGEFAKTSSSEWEHYADSQSLAEAVEKKPICEAVILIKGSRGIKMENVICKL